ncbi:MAG: NAD(P)-dependent oxidoreductase [Boseongicola sp.]
MSERIGVIGLGRMGWALASRLSDQGLDVRGWTRSGADPEKARAVSFAAIANLEDLVSASDVLILSLFDETAVRDVLAKLATLDLSAKLVVETSTVPPQVVRDCESAILEAGGRLIDAPISGGPEMVADGTMGLFIGGDADNVARFMPVATAGSDRIAHVGPLGAGAAMKIVNNVALAGSFQATAEALELGIALGLDFQKTLDVLSKGPAATPMFRSRIPKIIGDDAEVGFSLDGAQKDTAVFLSTARSCNVEVPALEAAAENVKAAVDAGHGQKDVAARIRYRLGLE